MSSSLFPGAAFPVVRDEPYIATARVQEIKTGPDGRRIVHEALNIHMRDSAGRLRDEQIASAPDAQGASAQATVQVVDPVAMRDLRWNEDTKTIVTDSIPAGFRGHRQGPIITCAEYGAASHADDSAPGQETYEDLGERRIEGISTYGCRTTRRWAGQEGTPDSGVRTTETWASPELQIDLLTAEHSSDGTERLTQLSRIRREEPDPTLFQVPGGFMDPRNVQRPAAENTNPNYQAVREHGRIEWHEGSATLVASSSRPLDMVAMTISSCLGATVNAEDPQYRFQGDLLDVTAPEWAADHPDDHVYVAKPAKVEIRFAVDEDGSASDLHGLLQDSVGQVNQQQSGIYGYELQESVNAGRSLYTFVPTSSRNEGGVLEHLPAYLDQRITIAEQTAPVADLALLMTRAVGEATGMQLHCCQAGVAGQPWGTRTITYHATNQSARRMLEDLIGSVGENQSYILRCEPKDKRFCAISVLQVSVRKPPTAPRSGVCSAPGNDAS